MTGQSERAMNRLLRAARYGAYRMAQPFDAAFRWMNRLSHYPPVALRRHVSELGFVDGPGYEFVAYLKLLGQLQPDDVVWDIGCGCGLLELALETQGWRGRVVGTDIHRPSIMWANRTIAKRVPAFSFEHADIHHVAYWPTGRLSAEQWLASFVDKRFDLVVAKSFFTHLLPDETRLYLDAIASRLAPGGRALLSFFLLEAGTTSAVPAASARTMQFVRPDPTSRYGLRRLQAPTAGVAYEESLLREECTRAGLEVSGMHYGTWSGRADGLSFQDLAVLRKA
jgi:SAM-dependent methyltransferase